MAEPLVLSRADVAALRRRLPDVAAQTVAAVVAEVPAYAEAFAGEMGRTISEAVRLALAGFLDLAASPRHGDAGRPAAPAQAGAYALGRGEARSGRTADALLSAYRVGARVAWRELAGEAVAHGVAAQTVARFAELVFAYIDELSAASLAGHADETAESGRVRQRQLELLGTALLRGATEADLRVAAEQAAWTPPRTLTAVLLPQARAHGVAADERTLQLAGDDPGSAVLLVPDARRPVLLRAVADRDAVVGPARPWTQVRASYLRAVRARALGRHVRDTEAHLAELVLSADAEALADLRAQVLAPLAAVRPSSREKLEETLRAWLLHHGRRDDVAGALFVHPQTVRYRVGQLRALYGGRLDDPEQVLALTVALGIRPVG